jgi:hypothetical protein
MLGRFIWSDGMLLSEQSNLVSKGNALRLSPQVHATGGLDQPLPHAPRSPRHCPDLVRADWRAATARAIR